MASISATGANGHHTFTLTVTEDSTSVSDNTSKCTYSFTMYGGTYDFNWTSKSVSWGLSIGDKSFSGSFGKYDKNTTLTISSNSNVVISHNNDGTKSINISFWISDGIGQSYTPGNCSANGTMTLTTIARASQPSCISWPNTTDDIGNMGDTITIHMNRKSSSFAHVVYYSWYNKSGTISGYATDNCQWTIPLDFANDIPNATSSWGTIYVDTYNGSTLIGTKSVNFTVHIPTNSNPVFTIDNVSYADINTAITNITHNNQKIVQNKSNLRITYTAATAKNGSSISQYTFVLNGATKTTTAAGGTVDFGTINSSQNLTLTVTVKDSRNLTTSITKTITMIPYSSPSALVTLKRLNNYEDTTTLIIDGSIASVENLNTMTIKYRYKQSGGDYNDLTEIEDNVAQTLTCDKNYSYIFEVQITDLMGSSFVKEYVLDKGKFPLFIDIKNLAVGVNEFPAPGEALRVADGIGNFEDGLKILGYLISDFIIEQGTSGIWTYEKRYSGIAMCWGKGSVSGTCTNQEGSVYFSDQKGIALPSGLFTQVITGNADCSDPWCWIGNVWTNASTIYFKIIRGSSYNATFSPGINLFVIGRWK